tara:strand:- start:670 stop:1428 length:759 start_codon:yes stop_codon:yes gene_type:complete
MISDDALGGTAGDASGPGEPGTGPGDDEYGFTNPYESASAKPSPGTKALVAQIEKRASQPPGIYHGDIDPKDRQAYARQYQDLRGIAKDIRDFEAGNRFFNPEASFWDYVTAPVETFISLGSRALSGGIIGLDPQFGKDVFGIKGQTDLSHAASGIYGPQNPGLQVDLGGPTSSLGLMGSAVPDVMTIDISPSSPISAHTTFSPQGTVGSAVSGALSKAEALASGQKSFAQGGLASLPQISHSGLYRAMGRG